ncbi:TPA: AAA family ATPase [Neisseria subflava]|jgi:ATP binding protein
MKFSTLTLNNFRAFKHIDLSFHPKLTVLAGVNGSGKTTLLDAYAIMLSRIVSYIEDGKINKNTIRINDSDIQNGENRAKISLINGDELAFSINKSRKGIFSLEKDDVQHAKKYAETIQQRIENSRTQATVPVFIYYQTQRAVIDFPKRIRTAHKFDLVETYDNSLNGEINFRLFFEWFREREDLENEIRLRQNMNYRDGQLNAVREALTKFLPHITDIQIRRIGEQAMIAKENGREISINQLSDGAKILFASIGDLARRLAMANPMGNDPLLGNGIVLIDELELHLHPKWQREIIRKLPKVFPNIQFVVSTHSPQIISEVAAESLYVLNWNKKSNQPECTKPVRSLGLNTADVLSEIMDSRIINQEFDDKVEEVYQYIEQEQWEEAERTLEDLEKQYGELPELLRASSYLMMLKP